MAIQRARRLGLVAGAALTFSLLIPAPAVALPAGTPKTGMVCLQPTGSPGNPEFDLVANSGTIQTPDGNTVFMWGYSTDGAPGYPSFQSPGPVLCVTQGDLVTVHLRNTLAEPVSITFPGLDTGVAATGGVAAQPGDLAPAAGASGGTVTYTFTASQPGTYLYESGTDVAKQVEMGLYGALIVRPASNPAQAYADPSTVFDASREYLILLAEIDPDLHHAIETGGTFDFSTKHDRYYTVNGRSFPDTIQDNGSSLLPNQPYGALVKIRPNDATHPNPALIRMLNAGSDNHPFHPHGNHLREIAQDGRLLVAAGGGSASTERFGETIGSGETEDFLLRWDDKGTDTSGNPFDDEWNPTTNPLPVAQPNYRNLTFKDSTTWYSGSPYLGYKGTLPTGTNSLNLCGEWYFPWHSHALNEFTNFDEGFGGMATLLRVDPAGGCFGTPSSTKITVGSLTSGTTASMAIDDGTYYRVHSALSGTSQLTDWYAQFSGLPSGASNLHLSYTGNNAAIQPAAVTQNFNTLSSGTSSTVLPAGWALAESGTGADTAYAGNNGSSTTANTYSYGTTTGDRALGVLRGTLPGNTFSSFIGASFTNATGWPITSLQVSYTGEEWHKAGNGADTLQFEYSTNATSLTTGTWTGVTALNFTSPVTTAGVATLNGNAAANRTAKTATITGLNIPNGATYRIRWSEPARAAGLAHDGLAVDDVTVQATASIVPPIPTALSIWNWAGTGSWAPIAGATANVGDADVAVASNLAVPSYVGTGSNKGLVRIRVLTGGAPSPFITGADFMQLVYDAP